MGQASYAYSATPTRNPLRFLLALWRSMRNLNDTEEVAIVQMGFARSRTGRRFARWDNVLASLRSDARTANAIDAREEFGVVDLTALLALPAGTLGRVFAEHCQARGLNPNLVRIPGDTDEDWLLRHLYATHDLWHVVTGWGNDEVGEVGLGGFYLAQLNAPFIAFLFALILLNTVFRKPNTLRERMVALVAGYRGGCAAQPLVGVSWQSLWRLPLGEVRAQLVLSGEVTGERDPRGGVNQLSCAER